MAKKPLKKTKAELAEEAELAFKKMQDRWDRAPKFAGKFRTVQSVPPSKLGKYSDAEKRAAEAELFSGAEDFVSDDVVMQSTRTKKFVSGVGAKKTSMKYTGTKMLGTAGLHKSNEVPVFDPEHIVEIAKMRR